MTTKERKRWAGPVLVARTVAKETAADPDVWFWKEYRVRPLTPAEFDALRGDGTLSNFAPYKPFLIETRRVDGTADRTPTNPWEWKGWMTGDSPAEVIDEMLGDSSFLDAESLVPEHAELAAHVKALKVALNAEWNAEKADNAAAVAVATFKDTHNRDYAKKIAGKSEEEAKKIGERMGKRLAPRLAELRAEARAANAALRAAREAVKAARSAKPKCGTKVR